LKPELVTISNPTPTVYWHLFGPKLTISAEKTLARFGNLRSHCALMSLNEIKAPIRRKKESKNFFMVLV
jgi:hypothetical protein